MSEIPTPCVWWSSPGALFMFLLRMDAAVDSFQENGKRPKTSNLRNQLPLNLREIYNSAHCYSDACSQA
jgi:hypothetical protein